jgi:hypothetical protein
MTQIYTVAAYSETTKNVKHIEFLGHFISGQPCIEHSKCSTPKACADKWYASYPTELGHKVAVLGHSYRQKVSHQLFRKADYAARTVFGLLNA